MKDGGSLLTVDEPTVWSRQPFSKADTQIRSDLLLLDEVYGARRRERDVSRRGRHIPRAGTQFFLCVLPFAAVYLSKTQCDNEIHLF